MSVKVRFAPSPTGFVHIGSLRTALYNYLFAKKMGGKYILRVEDTDRTRLVDGAIENMLNAMKWAGVNHDEGVMLDENGNVVQKGEYGPYIQSERLDIYQQYIKELLDSGKAYYCFCTKERLDEVREKAFGIHSEESNNDAGADLDQYDIEESNFMDNDLLDLSEDKPEVKKVTVGDAEEYFEDLGLEYNVDYKDLSKDNTRVGRRYKEENVEHEPQIIEEKKVEPVVEEKKEEPLPPVIEKKEQVEDKTDEDNLFDLIDSMYEKE